MTLNLFNGSAREKLKTIDLVFLCFITVEISTTTEKTTAIQKRKQIEDRSVGMEQFSNDIDYGY